MFRVVTVATNADLRRFHDRRPLVLPPRRTLAHRGQPT